MPRSWYLRHVSTFGRSYSRSTRGCATCAKRRLKYLQGHISGTAADSVLLNSHASVARLAHTTPSCASQVTRLVAGPIPSVYDERLALAAYLPDALFEGEFVLPATPGQLSSQPFQGDVSARLFANPMICMAAIDDGHLDAKGAWDESDFLAHRACLRWSRRDANQER